MLGGGNEGGGGGGESEVTRHEMTHCSKKPLINYSNHFNARFARAR